jgi:hypothetical protein
MSQAKLLSACLVACVCAAFPPTTKASPLPYVMELTTLSVVLPSDCPNPISTALRFDCDVAVGDTFVGTFSLVDTSILTAGVSPVNATVAHFVLAVGGLVWAQDFPYPASMFQGFRAGGTFTSTQLGFIVDGGEITTFSLGTDVYGTADVPFVDFYPDAFAGLAYPRFFAADAGGATISGSYALRAVDIPEPPPLSLIVLGFAGVGLLRLCRKSKAETRLGPRP